LRFISHYHDHPAYIAALADSVRHYQLEHGTADKLLFSYHGIPQRSLDLGDPYHCECLKTSRLVAESLGLSETQYVTTFQSRFGRAQWLQPYTEETLKSFPGEGVKTVHVICPGFAADCLETLEEIGVENRRYFLDAGGEEFAYIPCLNSTPEHVKCLHQIITEQLSGWLD
jgi:ferrochelatase